MNNNLLLFSGADIPFVSAKITIHPPTIKEISYIGEEAFFTACDFLTFSKEEKFLKKDQIHLSNYSDFDILMSMITDKTLRKKINLDSVDLLLSLIFPNYEIKYTKDAILFNKDNTLVGEINNNNFCEFKNIIKEIFCLDKLKGQNEYNPAGDAAKKIANKFKKARQKRNQFKDKKDSPINILLTYVYVLSIGQNISINTIFQYTIYQLFVLFDGFGLKEEQDNFIRTRLAGGAKNVKMPEDWHNYFNK